MVLRRRQTREKGNAGEDLGVDYLKGRGFRIVARNYRTRFGEIDIVAEHGGELVFVEVRSLSSSSGHLPEETIGFEKQKRLSLTAQAYLQENRLEDRVARFDILAIEIDGRTSTVRHLPDAFEVWEP